jgi:hypothetical protein
MKDYLNKEERLQLLFLKKYIDNLEKMLESQNITKEEHKNLKMAMSFGLKGFNSKVERLNETALKTFWNSIKEAFINVEDRYAVEMYNKKLHTEMDAAYELNKDYYRLIELMFDNNCKNCTKSNRECEIYKEFESHCIPDPGEDNGNCRYAYSEVKK